MTCDYIVVIHFEKLRYEHIFEDWAKQRENK